jgi:hypothetical protein
MKANSVNDRSRSLLHKSGASSLMSNTKWRKLALVLDEIFPNGGRSVTKLLGDERLRIGAPLASALIYHAFRPVVWDLNGFPTSLLDIEWTEISMTDDEFQRFNARLSPLGKFPVERTEEGIRITGHELPLEKPC